MNPCIDYCYVRFNKHYTPECNGVCEYANEVHKRKELEQAIRNIRREIKEEKLSYTNKEVLAIIDRALEEVQEC